MEGKINIVCMVDNTVLVNIPEFHFRHEWKGRGTKFAVPKEIVEQMTYDQGARYMLDTGMLYIEDMNEKIDLGLEPDGATEPQNIIVLKDSDMNRYARFVPFVEFKDTLDKVSIEQVRNLAQFMIDNKIFDIDKFDYIKKRTGRDCLKAIELEKKDKED